MCISAALGVGSALIGAGSARSAARSQERAAQQQLDLSREQYDTTRADLAPFRDAGGNALAAYQFELGLGERPTFGGTAPQIQTIAGTPQAMPQGNFRLADRDNPEGFYDERGGFMGGRPQSSPTRYSVNGQVFDTMEQAQAFAAANTSGGQQYGGISMSPGTRFAMEEGRDTIEAGAAARSGLNSGATLAGLERLRFGLSAQDRETQLNRLGGLTQMGQNAAGMNAANSANFTQNANNAFGAMGNAQSAGAIGVGNALQGGLQNLTSMWGYQQAMQPQNSLAPTTSLRPQARPF
jgi:hypothetical protein